MAHAADIALVLLKKLVFELYLSLWLVKFSYNRFVHYGLKRFFR
jgi:hypothetical protein